MTDDELELALFALPLEAPPGDLRARILAATVDRPALTFAAWEIWAVGTLLAFMVWLAFLVLTSVPNFALALREAVDFGVDRFADSISPPVLVWTGLGFSFVIWVSALSLPATRGKIAGR